MGVPMQPANTLNQLILRGLGFTTALLLGPLVLQAANPDALPLRATKGLFDVSAKQTLGLK
ncbi:MAG: hypothetical protein VB862_08570, partial [Pirellulaceae bacterium]